MPTPIDIPSLTLSVATVVRPICDTLAGDFGGSLSFTLAIEHSPGLLDLLTASDPEAIIVDQNGTLDPTKACKVKYFLAIYQFHKDVVSAYQKNYAGAGQPIELRVLDAINVLAINPTKNVFAIMAPRPGA